MLALHTVSIPAQDRSGSDPAFAPDSIQAEITYLASDALRGRGSGEPGNEMAARFIAQAFARDGLQPLGTRRQRDPNAPMDGSGFFQPFRFLAGRAVGQDNMLEAAFPVPRSGALKREPDLVRKAYRPNTDFEPSGISGGGRAEGEVVFTGYGIRAPQADHDDYAGVDVRGRIVLLLAGAPGGALAPYGDLRRKASTAREQGAAAVLVVLPQNSDAAWQPSRFDLAGATDAGLPILLVRRPIVEDWLQRSGKSLEGLENDANAGKNVSIVTGARVRLSADVRQVEKVTANVAGLIEGSDPVLKKEFVVIGAHLDHLGMGGPGSLAKSSAPAIHHGADDNASGTAGVMQLARYFGTMPPASRPKRSLLLICFSGEELGLLGSDYYVKHPLKPLAQTVAMLNMDMVGRLRDDRLIVIGSGTAKEWDHLLDEVNKTAGFTLSKSESGFGASDQQSFYTHDVPVLFFFTGIHPDYHTPTDTADKINAPGEAKVLRMVAACAEQIADSPARPTFQRIQTPEQNAPRRGLSVYFGSVPDYAAQVAGVQLSGVREGSPAEKAGLKAGDIIIKFGDRDIKNIYDYTYALQDHKPGDRVQVVVRRGSRTLTLTATLAARSE
ncbi:MAG TPA: M28 family peptidase [Chthonomonadaceae bacterium]|nr:M28 family peptidase [Chthonomonadaceae bacterium]